MDQIMDIYAQKLNEILGKVESAEIQQFLTSLQFAVNFMKKI